MRKREISSTSTNYLTAKDKIPVFLDAKIANITISDQQQAFRAPEAHSNIQGIGSCFIT